MVKVMYNVKLIYTVVISVFCFWLFYEKRRKLQFTVGTGYVTKS